MLDISYNVANTEEVQIMFSYFLEVFRRDLDHWKSLRWSIAAYLPLYLVAGTLPNALWFCYVTRSFLISALWLNLIGATMFLLAVHTHNNLAIEVGRRKLAAISALCWVLIMWSMGALFVALPWELSNLGILFTNAIVGTMFILVLTNNPETGNTRSL